MGLKVYFDLMSQPSRAVLVFLKINNIPYIPVVTEIIKGAHVTPEYTNINPFQKVPCVDHDGFCLTESVAIMKYIVATHANVAEHWYPHDVKIRARVDEFLSWQQHNVRLNAAFVFRSRFLEPLMSGKPVNEDRCRRFETGLTDTIGLLERAFLSRSDGAYLCPGDRPTLADVVGVCEMMQPTVVGFDVAACSPAVATWMERVRADTQPHFDDVHRVLYTLRSKYASEHAAAADPPRPRL